MTTVKKLKIQEIEKNFDSTIRDREFFVPPKGEQPIILDPYRISSYGIGLYHGGEIDVTANLKKYNLKPKSLLIISPNVISD